MRRWLLLVALLVLAAAALWVRLAPVPVAVWHSDPTTDAAPDGALRLQQNGARVALVLLGTPAAALARLDAVAMASPRTIRLAGSPEEGRISWVTRTLVWGFPDVTTATARPDGKGARLDIFARQVFGGNDWGVNGRRLADWLAHLSP